MSITERLHGNNSTEVQDIHVLKETPATPEETTKEPPPPPPPEYLSIQRLGTVIGRLNFGVLQTRIVEERVHKTGSQYFETRVHVRVDSDGKPIITAKGAQDESVVHLQPIEKPKHIR